MIVRKYRIRNDQYRFLKKLNGNESEHVRSAIDDYKLKKEREKLNVSLSPSKSQKGGDKNAESTSEEK